MRAAGCKLPQKCSFRVTCTEEGGGRSLNVHQTLTDSIPEAYGSPPQPQNTNYEYHYRKVPTSVTPGLLLTSWQRVSFIPCRACSLMCPVPLRLDHI